MGQEGGSNECVCVCRGVGTERLEKKEGRVVAFMKGEGGGSTIHAF